jgi:hypothetical protein
VGNYVKEAGALTEETHALAALLHGARRRFVSQVVFEQGAVALGVAFGGAILLLLLGTQILDWYWLVLLFGASFGLGLWRTLRRVPSSYRLAQIIDARMNLHDSISTALFYAGGTRRADPELLEYQHAEAERAARRIHPAQVFPMRMPKALYAAGGVALVAFGMFAIRYGVTRSLDLRPSLVRIAFETLWPADNRAAADKKSDLRKKIEDQLKKLGISVGSPDTEAKERDSDAQTAMNTTDVPDASAEPGDASQANVNKTESDQAPGDGDSEEKGGRATGSEDPGAQVPPDAAPQATAEAAKQDPAQKNAASQSNDKSGLLDRMRDAMANLLNKLNMQPKGGETRQQMSKSSQKGGAGQKSESQKGAQSQRPDSSGASSPDQQGQQQGDGEKAQAAQGRTGDKNGQREPSSDSKSGIGKEDGDKSAREAEQLAAMGRISEILGKRAQNMSGELMVEVAGGNQQLKTAYSGKEGKHVEAGGEITRDEVPLIYRDFVQQYFEKVRRAPLPNAAKEKSAEAAPGKKPSKVTE